MAFVRVARLDELPDGGTLRVELGGIEVGLFRVGEQVYALENRCPHAGDPLHAGMLDGCVITCASHGWAFDVRTGHRPEDADGFPIPSFSVRIDGGEIFVDLQAPTNARRRTRRPA